MQDLKAIRFVEGTKISHDYDGDVVDTFSYRHLVQNGLPAIGIPGKQNRLIIVDVDVLGVNHKKDGREWWNNFYNSAGLTPTYMVGTRSGGYHYYYWLPESINPDTFFPPSELAPGVDIKYNGWVAAPPTAGYQILWGTIADIQVAPPSLMMEINNKKNKNHTREFTFDGDFSRLANTHREFTEAQIKMLKSSIEVFRKNGGVLSRQEWRDGLFSLKAGIQNDPQLLEELASAWTTNGSYEPGDENIAHEIISRAEVHGGIGPGTISGILKTHIEKMGGKVPDIDMGREEVIAISRVRTRLGEHGDIKMETNETNAAQIIGAMHPITELYYDTRKDHFIFKGKSRPDSEIVNLLLPKIQSEAFGFNFEKFKKSTIASGLDIVMTSRKIDPHKEWLESLRWDKKNRIEEFFIKYLMLEDTKYNRAVSKNFWIAMGGRGVQPGIKVDNMIVIEGAEGVRKSSLVKVIGGDYTYAPTSKKLMQDLDELRKMHQAVIVELPELVGFIGQEEEIVKNFLSKDRDSIRALYARTAMESLRGFVFVGTTNNGKYLTRAMGARRYWPIKVPKELKFIDLMSIESEREQLFAEGVARFRNAESFHEVPKDEHDSIIRSRVTVEPLAAPVLGYLRALPEAFPLTDVYMRLESMGFVTKGLTGVISRRIEDALIICGCEEIETNEGVKWRLKPVVNVEYGSLI